MKIYFFEICSISLKSGLKIIVICHFSLKKYANIYFFSIFKNIFFNTCGRIKYPFDHTYELFGKTLREYPHISPQSDPCLKMLS